MTPQLQDPKALAREFGMRIVGDGHAIPSVGITADSRAAGPGIIFAALPGTNRHGAEFAEQAHKAGSSLFLTDSIGAKIILDQYPTLAVMVADEPRLALAKIASSFYPMAPERVVAVTGTNGKTSTASFVRQIWQGLGLTAVNFGTAGVEGAVEAATKHTTPEPVALHQLLSMLADDGVTHAAMEASSHGLDQFRLDGVRVQVGGFTNLSRDHMDYHPSFGDYFAAKAGLFDRVMPAGSTAVINLDDPFGETMRLVAEGRGHRVITTGKHENAVLRLMNQRFVENGQEILVEYQGVRARAKLQLIGDFQAENLLVAIGIVMADPAHSFSEVMAVLPRLRSVRGRMQLVGNRQNGASVFVDYAHTPEALTTALRAIRPHVAGQLIVVFGAGGDRDRGKRPLMGEAAIANSDVAIITDDNPRSEDPAAIRAEIKAAAPTAIEVGDRAEAILRAVDMAQAGDVVLIAGKGHETGQIVGDHVLPFDDVEQASLSIAVLEGREQ